MSYPLGRILNNDQSGNGSGDNSFLMEDLLYPPEYWQPQGSASTADWLSAAPQQPVYPSLGPIYPQSYWDPVYMPASDTLDTSLDFMPAQTDWSQVPAYETAFGSLDMTEQPIELPPISMVFSTDEPLNTNDSHTPSSNSEDTSYGARTESMALDEEVGGYGSPRQSLDTFYSPDALPREISQSTSSAAVTGQLALDISDTETTDKTEICYGMLYAVDTKLIGNMTVIYNKIKQSALPYQSFKLQKRDHDQIVLCFRDDNCEFGTLRTDLGKWLGILQNIPDTDIDIQVPTPSLSESIERINKPADAMIKSNVYIYGQRRRATEMEVVFSKGKLWLQRPGEAMRSVEYENPQFLKIELTGTTMQHIQPVNRGQTARSKPISKNDREERLRKMVEEVYMAVDNTQQLEMVEGGDRVIQTLLQHQKEAVGFMLKRESGQLGQESSLWEAAGEEDGCEIYRHKITRVRARGGIRPVESRGGILADEMGLGKSLSILALIEKTLEDGKQWAEQNISSLESGNASKHSGATLVVVPSVLLIENWEEEIRKDLTGDHKVLRYHGSSRTRKIDDIAASDIVLTTYHTLATEFQKRKSFSCLHQVNWYRVVLDEAHIIRRQSTHFHKVCADLQANSRWCLTGTPIQNKLSDIGALFSFLRTEPFSKPSTFRKWFELPFEQQTDESKVRDRLVDLLGALCLRRTREIIKLPEPQQITRKLKFSEAECKRYEETRKILARRLQHRVGTTNEELSKFSLFQLTLQMRLLCNHGTFQHRFSWRRSIRDEREAAESMLDQDDIITCPLCFFPMPILGSKYTRDRLSDSCTHKICSDCVEVIRKSDGGEDGKLKCPLCKSNKSRADCRETSLPDEETTMDNEFRYFNSEGHSTKMRAVVEDVQKDLLTTKRHVYITLPNPFPNYHFDVKSIVFSCWTNTLNLLSIHLKAANISYFRVDGGSSNRVRQKNLKKFAQSNDVRVLIMTTGTGGFGLNLTCANRIFLVEPQWNPSVESQAIARAIRLGQESEVLVVRYLIEKTEEEAILGQQKRKTWLAALGFGRMDDENAS